MKYGIAIELNLYEPIDPRVYARSIFFFFFFWSGSSRSRSTSRNLDREADICPFLCIKILLVVAIKNRELCY